jgi:hypothetical protein
VTGTPEGFLTPRSATDGNDRDGQRESEFDGIRFHIRSSVFDDGQTDLIKLPENKKPKVSSS